MGYSFSWYSFPHFAGISIVLQIAITLPNSPKNVKRLNRRVAFIMNTFILSWNNIKLQNFFIKIPSVSRFGVGFDFCFFFWLKIAPILFEQQDKINRMHAEKRVRRERKTVELLSGSNTLALSDGSSIKLHKSRILKYRNEKAKRHIVNSSCELQLQLRKCAMYIREMRATEKTNDRLNDV